jgi:hypothetical protein
MSDLLSASSLLMAIAAILFSLWYSEIAKALEVVPKQYSVDNVASRVSVSAVLFSKALPVAVMALAVAAIFLPDALKLAKESFKLFSELGLDALEKYDAVRTAYCFVTVLSILLAIYMCVLVAKLLSLRKRLS